MPIFTPITVFFLGERLQLFSICCGNRLFVIPAQAGIQDIERKATFEQVDPRFRGGDSLSATVTI